MAERVHRRAGIGRALHLANRDDRGNCPCRPDARPLPAGLASHRHRSFAAVARRLARGDGVGAAGIAGALRNGGRLELARQTANHESLRTTSLGDRRHDQLPRVSRVSRKRWNGF